jgi:acetylornithine deacetylase/succinyl-diaminopimelate desuccinylase-like protein
VETAEKGSMWLRLAARGTSGHGSLLHTDNPIATLARALDRLDRHRFPVVLTDPVRSFLSLSGVPFDERDPEASLPHLGHVRRLIEATLRDTATVTIVSAGTKSNVVPSVARAELDGRTLPGRDEQFRAELGRVLGPEIEVEWDSLPAVSTTFDGDLVAAIGAAVAAEDPGARLLPYMLAAGTDAKAFARLGIRHFGFAPLRLPPELDFTALFHGVDERVPVSALRFGTRVLDRLLRTA